MNGMMTQEEAMNMIEEAKDQQIAGGYTLTKSGYVVKTKINNKKHLIIMWQSNAKEYNISRQHLFLTNMMILAIGKKEIWKRKNYA